jgi:hypothetical protein
MKYLKIAVLISFLLVGCSKSRSTAPSQASQMRQWKVTILAPDGKTSIDCNVYSYEKPLPYFYEGGTTGLRDPRGGLNFHEWEKSLFAPVGWAIVVKEIPENSETPVESD